MTASAPEAGSPGLRAAALRLGAAIVHENKRGNGWEIDGEKAVLVPHIELQDLIAAALGLPRGDAPAAPAPHFSEFSLDYIKKWIEGGTPVIGAPLAPLRELVRFYETQRPATPAAPAPLQADLEVAFRNGYAGGESDTVLGFRGKNGRGVDNRWAEYGAFTGKPATPAAQAPTSNNSIEVMAALEARDLDALELIAASPLTKGLVAYAKELKAAAQAPAARPLDLESLERAAELALLYLTNGRLQWAGKDIGLVVSLICDYFRANGKQGKIDEIMGQGEAKGETPKGPEGPATQCQNCDKVTTHAPGFGFVCHFCWAYANEGYGRGLLAEENGHVPRGFKELRCCNECGTVLPAKGKCKGRVKLRAMAQGGAPKAAEGGAAK